MKPIQFIRLLLRNKLLLSLIPLVTVITIYIGTRNSPEKYKSSTTVYTGFASGYSIENGEKAKIDFHAINISFDNLLNLLKSKETKEEIVLRLLANHIFLNKKADINIRQANLDRLNDILPKDIINKVLDKKSEENTYNNLLIMKADQKNTIISDLLNNEKEPFYAIESLSDIRINRVESSDMVKIEFENNDPGVCRKVLEITTEVLIKKFRSLKQGETSNVSEFFELQTKLALEKLNAAEENLKTFRSENRLINYYEQTKFISEKREDLIDELNKEKMVLASSEAAINNTEEKLGKNKKTLKTNNEIIATRNKIADLTSKLLILQNSENTGSHAEASKLNLEINQLKNELDEKVNNLFGENTSKEGISYKEIAKTWLENAINADESKARLPIYTKRLEEIETTYDQFAPLGSNLNKMEREISIAEKEYLNHLASLNAARLREQNLSMNSNLKVVDSPTFSIQPLPNSRKLYLLGGGITSIILTIAFLIAIEILDQTIKSPDRAEKLINKKIIGGVPFSNKKTIKLEKDGTLQRMWNIIRSNLFEQIRKQNKKQFIVSLSSNRKKEGKTFIAKKIAEQFTKANKKVLLLVPANEKSTKEEELPITYYDAGINYIEYETISDLTKNITQIDQFDLILIEFLAFSEQKAPVGISEKCDLNIFVCTADRLWEDSDNRALSEFQSTCSNDVYVILNKMSWYFLEMFLGDINDSKGKIRKTIKKWIKLDFSN